MHHFSLLFTLLNQIFNYIPYNLLNTVILVLKKKNPNFSALASKQNTGLINKG